MAQIDRLIAETRAWRIEHHNARRQIEAAACAIREKALLDARSAAFPQQPAIRFQSVLK